jgi:uncharacterized membrane protein HdeD (DUF308 family)
MPHQDLEDQRSWWKLVLSGLLAIVFGVAAIVLPVQILSARVLDLIFGLAKPFSASMSAVAALLALIALVAIDGLVNLFGTGIAVKRASTIRGVVGVAVAIAAVFWPDQTVAAAVGLIGIWAIVIGVLELLFARYASENAKQRALLIIAGIASVAIGVGMMRKVFIGAVLVSVFVGIAAAARGLSLIMLGVSRRLRRGDESEKQAVGQNAA